MVDENLTDEDITGAPVLHMSCLSTGDDAQISRYCAYHLAICVRRIYVYVDGPASCSAIRDNANIEIINCDAPFWARLGVDDPHILKNKQEAVLRLASETAYANGAAFLAHIDQDELVAFECSMEALIANIPPDINAVRMPCREAVARLDECRLHPFAATHFKIPLHWHLLRIRGLLYGAPRHLLRRGFFGHTQGKILYRLPVRYKRIGGHGPHGTTDNVGSTATFPENARAVL
ncbi:MAG: hypothetical protein ACTSSQ_08660, partial [Alphaproteobacteria bacterium]